MIKTYFVLISHFHDRRGYLVWAHESRLYTLSLQFNQFILKKNRLGYQWYKIPPRWPPCMVIYALLSQNYNQKHTRKLCYRKDDRAMPLCDLYMDALKFSGLPDYAHRYYSQHFSWAFVSIEAMNVRTKFEVRSFTHSWDNRGYPKYLGSPWIRPRSIFSKIFNGLLFGLAL